MAERRIGTQIQYEKIFVNDHDDYISVCVEDANFLDRFVNSFLQIQDEYEKSQKEIEAAEKEHDGNDLEETVAVSRVHVAFSEKGVEIIDHLFGEGTVKKYFRGLYENDENFLPGIQAFEDFFEQIKPEIEDIFGQSLEKYMADKQKKQKAAMEKYQPQDHKRPQK